MPVELVDSHCHLDLIKPREGALDGVVAAARANGVGHMLCACVTLEKLPRVLDVAGRFAGVFASVGVHPNEKGEQDPAPEVLADLARDPRVVAIGETGLDYYRSEGDLEWQRDRFPRHIAAAKASGLPLIIHSRSAPTSCWSSGIARSTSPPKWRPMRPWTVCSSSPWSRRSPCPDTRRR